MVTVWVVFGHDALLPVSLPARLGTELFANATAGRTVIFSSPRTHAPLCGRS